MTEHNFSLAEKTYINSEVMSRKKSIAAAYVLCGLFGALGLHRAYMNKNGSQGMLIAFIIGLVTLIIFVGFAILAVLEIIALVDAFKIQSWSQADEQQVRKEVMAELTSDEQTAATD